MSTYGSTRWNTSRRQPLNAECLRRSCIIIIFGKTSRPKPRDGHVRRVSKRGKCTSMFLFLSFFFPLYIFLASIPFSLSLPRPLVMASLLRPLFIHSPCPLNSALSPQPSPSFLLTHSFPFTLYIHI